MAKLVRILNIIASLDPSHGGPIEGALQLAGIWQRQQHQIAFASLDHPSAPYLKALPYHVAALGHVGSPTRKEGPLSFRERYGYSSQLVPWLCANVNEYDSILVHGLWNYSTVAARRALVRTKVPYFVFPHGCLDPWFKRTYWKKDVLKYVLWPFNEGVLMNNATAVMFTTEEERELAANAYWPWRIHPAVVGFGSSDVSGDKNEQIRAFRAAVPALGERPYLLFLSRLHAKKGCDLLINAFARIADAHPELDLVMAGPDQKGWLSALKAQAEALQITDRVHWTGMISAEVKWGAFRGAEAFVLTSHSENFGIVVAEALASSRPVLITDKVNLWREVAADRAGLVEPDTQEGANRLLGRFLAMNEERRAAMGQRARVCFETHFRMETTADKVLRTIRTFGKVKA